MEKNNKIIKNNFAKQLQEAHQYIEYGIKNGHYEADDFTGMNDEDIIKFANDQMGLADLIANQ